MNKETWFFQTEILISQYFKNEDRLNRLQEMEKILTNNLRLLDHELAEFKRIPGLTAKYNPAGRAKNLLTYDYSDLMEEYENQFIRIFQQIFEKYKKLVSIQYRVYAIREFNAPLEMAMKRLSAEEKILMEQKYGFKTSNYQIASLLHCSEKRVRYMHRKIIVQIAERLNKKDSYEFTRSIEA
jgi:hypothetical protein